MYNIYFIIRRRRLWGNKVGLGYYIKNNKNHSYCCRMFSLWNKERNNRVVTFAVFAEYICKHTILNCVTRIFIVLTLAFKINITIPRLRTIKQ